ncbi:MAG: hypothetical protein M9928_11180 [Anaerolineae bacterium]|nr:hypothetical protein [Anaerolineae bacterium]
MTHPRIKMVSRIALVVGGSDLSLLLLALVLTVTMQPRSVAAMNMEANLPNAAASVTGTVQFGVDSYGVGEMDGTAIVTVTLNPAQTENVTATVMTIEDTATANSDYTPITKTVVFTPGRVQLTVTVPITNDLVYELEETLWLTITTIAPPTVTLGAPATATVQIVDDDPPPLVSFSSTDYYVDESEPSADLTVTLDAIAETPVSTTVAIVGGTATSGDYSLTTNELVFPPGTLTQIVTVAIMPDDVYEGDETVELELLLPTRAATTAQQIATLHIVEDDPLPQLSFSDATYSAAESDSSIAIALTLNSVAAVPVSGMIHVTSGTASATDYSLDDDTVLFPPGVTTEMVTVSLTQDDVYERDETVELALGMLVSATAGTPDEATLTIENDDDPPQIMLDSDQYTTAEDAGPVAITILLSGETELPAMVALKTKDGSAQVSDNDYVAVDEQIVFEPGETEETREITIVADTKVESNEFFEIELDSAIDATIVEPESAMVTITNDDGLFLPLVLSPPPRPSWTPVDDTFKLESRGIGVCPTNDEIRYVGTTNGLYEWENGKWVAVSGPTGIVRSIVFAGDNCEVVYATSESVGVWQYNGNEWRRVDDNFNLARAVVVRDDTVFIAGGPGIQSATWVTETEHSWNSTNVVLLTTNMSLNSGRIYATTWQSAIRFNDDNDSSNWGSNEPPPTDKGGLDIVRIGGSNGPQVYATINATWQRVDSSSMWDKKLSGITYTLANSSECVFAGQDDGVKWSSNAGEDWEQLGNLMPTVRDLTVAGDKLYAATEDGVYVYGPLSATGCGG